MHAFHGFFLFCQCIKFMSFFVSTMENLLVALNYFEPGAVISAFRNTLKVQYCFNVLFSLLSLFITTVHYYICSLLHLCLLISLSVAISIRYNLCSLLSLFLTSVPYFCSLLQNSFFRISFGLSRKRHR